LIAQDAGIMGVVNDASNNQSLPGVTIKYSSTSGTVSDSKGQFNLSLSPGTYTISFSFIGYETQTSEVAIKEGEIQLLVIRMKQKLHELSTVVISASRYEQKLEEISVSMNVVESEFIEKQAATNVETVVEQVPGVNIIDGQANIRGGSGYSYGAGSRVMILVDDIQLLAADANDPKWNAIPIEWTEQIEVMKGASSALYGSSALNGVMHFRSKEVADSAETNFSASASIYDAPDLKSAKWWDDPRFIKSFSATHSNSINSFSWQGGMNVFDDDGFKLGEIEKRYRVNGSLFYTPDKIKGLRLGVRANYQESESGTFLIWEDDTSGAYLPDGTYDGNSSIIPSKTKRLYIDPQIRLARSEKISHKILGRYFKTDNINQTNQQSFSDWYFGEYQANIKFHDHLSLLTGSGGSYTKVTSELYGNHSAYNAFFYVQLNGTIKKLNFSIGGRIEENGIDKKSSDLVPVMRIGLNYPITKSTFIRSSFGQGFRYPSIAERFIRTQVGTIVIYPNDSLQDETGWTAELGLRQLIQKGILSAYFDVALFRMEYKDMMEFSFGQWGNIFTDPFAGIGFKSINIGNTRIDGLDIGIGFQLKPHNWQINCFGGYTTLNPIKLDFNLAKDSLSNTATTNVLKYRYRNTLKSDLEISHKTGLLAGITTRYNSAMENIDKSFDALIDGVKSYRLSHTNGDLIWDARIGFSNKNKYTLLFHVKNLTNRFYAGRPADMQAPRTFTVQVNYSL